MYSWEIDRKMRESNFDVVCADYMHICSTSPQISRVRYVPGEEMFEMWTHDDFYWKFKVHPTGVDEQEGHKSW